MRATATASSAAGSSTPAGAASTPGTPQSAMARRDPARSAALASPAIRKIAASSTRAINTGTAIN